MNKRSLRKRLHRRVRRSGHLSAVVATLRVPEEFLPAFRWSPGPGWFEAATGYCWFRPWWNGEHEVMVLTYDRDAADQHEYREVLVSGRLERDEWYGTFADKPHRIYNRALSGTLHVQPVPPAARDYFVYTRRISAHFRVMAYDLGYELSNKNWNTPFAVSPTAQISATGDAWMLSVECWMGDFTPYSYWTDLDCAVEEVATLADRFGADKVYVTAPTQMHLVDPLWGPAMNALKRVEVHS